MARCYSCQNKLKDNVLNYGLWVDQKNQIKEFCIDCAKKYWENKKNQTLSLNFRNGDPVLLFTIPRAVTYGARWWGELLFMDKGVCFLAFAEDDPVDYSGVDKATSLFGIIGGAAAAAVASQKDKTKRKEKVEQRERELEIAHHKLTTGNLKDFLTDTRSEAFNFIPREEIRKIEYQWDKGLTIKTKDLQWHFTLDGSGRARYHEIEPKIKEYLSTTV